MPPANQAEVLAVRLQIFGWFSVLICDLSKVSTWEVLTSFDVFWWRGSVRKQLRLSISTKPENTTCPPVLGWSRPGSREDELQKPLHQLVLFGYQDRVTIAGSGLVSLVTSRCVSRILLLHDCLCLSPSFWKRHVWLIQVCIHTHIFIYIYMNIFISHLGMRTRSHCGFLDLVVAWQGSATYCIPCRILLQGSRHMHSS